MQHDETTMTTEKPRDEARIFWLKKASREEARNEIRFFIAYVIAAYGLLRQ
jgi:hypothetical protein